MTYKKIINFAKWSSILSYYYLIDHQRVKRYQKEYNLPKPFKRIYHYHNKKTGGTSLNFEIHSLSGFEPKATYKRMFKFPHYAIRNGKMYTGWYKSLIERTAYYYAHSHQPSHLFNLPKNTFTITILRNPKDRIISNYKMLMHYKNNDIYHSSMKIYRPMLNEGFLGFVKQLPKTDLWHQLYKFSKIYNVNEAFEGVTNCSHYFLTENYDQGIKDLGNKLKLKLKSRHVRKSINSVTIKDKDIKFLSNILEPEIKLYEKVKNAYLKKQS